MTSIGLIRHHEKLILSYKKNALGGAKDEHFSCFHSSCQLGNKKTLESSCGNAKADLTSELNG